MPPTLKVHVTHLSPGRSKRGPRGDALCIAAAKHAMPRTLARRRHQRPPQTHGARPPSRWARKGLPGELQFGEATKALLPPQVKVTPRGQAGMTGDRSGESRTGRGVWCVCRCVDGERVRRAGPW